MPGRRREAIKKPETIFWFDQMKGEPKETKEGEGK